MEPTGLDLTDPWHSHLYFVFDCKCEGCDRRIDFQSFWDRVEGEGEERAERWAVVVAEAVRKDGWRILDDGVFCPECSRQRLASRSEV